jgi:hypothetical protein
VTPPAGRARHRGARAGWPATDFGAVRRSEELIEMLAGRRIPARLRTDPAVALLSSLTSDIDGAVCPVAGPRHRAGRTRQHGARSQSAWPHAAAAAAVAAAIATLTTVAAATLMIVGMFARLSAARARRPRY